MALLGERIKYLRNSNRLTQNELAAKVGVKKSTIAAYENDSRSPSYDVLRKLAKVFHVTIDSLLSDGGETVIRAADLTDEQIDIIDTIIESFRVNNLLRNSVENERAIADVTDSYRALNDKMRSEVEFRKGKDKGQNKEKAIEKGIE